MIKIERTYHPNGQVKTECPVVNEERHGKFIRYFENGQIAIESNYVHGQSNGLWTEYYENGQIAETGEYLNGEYHINNFWTETGDQLLKNGTGKKIERYGASGGDIYEQYFDKGRLISEKKIAGISYGGFIPKEK